MSETRYSIGSRIVGSVLLASLLSGCAALGLGSRALERRLNPTTAHPAQA